MHEATHHGGVIWKVKVTPANTHDAEVHEKSCTGASA